MLIYIIDQHPIQVPKAMSYKVAMLRFGKHLNTSIAIGHTKSFISIVYTRITYHSIIAYHPMLEHMTIVFYIMDMSGWEAL